VNNKKKLALHRLDLIDDKLTAEQLVESARDIARDAVQSAATCRALSSVLREVLYDGRTLVANYTQSTDPWGGNNSFISWRVGLVNGDAPWLSPQFWTDPNTQSSKSEMFSVALTAVALRIVQNEEPETWIKKTEPEPEVETDEMDEMVSMPFPYRPKTGGESTNAMATRMMINGLRDLRDRRARIAAFYEASLNVATGLMTAASLIYEGQQLAYNMTAEYGMNIGQNGGGFVILNADDDKIAPVMIESYGELNIILSKLYRYLIDKGVTTPEK